MDTTTIVTVGGYAVFLACVGVFLAMLYKLDAIGFVSRELDKHKNVISKLCIAGFTAVFFSAIFIAYLTVKDPPRMTKYLTNVCVPLWGHLTDY
jgi:hypothetical protein